MKMSKNFKNIDIFFQHSGKNGILHLKGISQFLIIILQNTISMKSLMISVALFIATYQQKMDVWPKPDYSSFDRNYGFGSKSSTINNVQGRFNNFKEPQGYRWKNENVYAHPGQADYQLALSTKKLVENIRGNNYMLDIQKPLNEQIYSNKLNILQTGNKQLCSDTQTSKNFGNNPVIANFREIISKLQKSTVQAQKEMYKVQNQLHKAQKNEEQIIIKINQNLELKKKLATQKQSAEKQIEKVKTTKLPDLQQSLSKSQTEIKDFESQIQKIKQQSNQIVKEKQDIQKLIMEQQILQDTQKTQINAIKAKINGFANQKQTSQYKLSVIEFQKKKIQEIILDEQNTIDFLKKKIQETEKLKKMHQQQILQIEGIKNKGETYIKDMQSSIDAQQVEFKNKLAIQQQIKNKIKQYDEQICKDKIPKIQDLKYNNTRILNEIEKKKHTMNQINAQIKKQTQYISQGGKFLEHINSTVKQLDANLEKYIQQRKKTQNIIQQFKTKINLIPQQLKIIQQSIQKTTLNLVSQNDQTNLNPDNFSSLSKAATISSLKKNLQQQKQANSQTIASKIEKEATLQNAPIDFIQAVNNDKNALKQGKLNSLKKEDPLKDAPKDIPQIVNNDKIAQKKDNLISLNKENPSEDAPKDIPQIVDNDKSVQKKDNLISLMKENPLKDASIDLKDKK